MSVIPEDGDLLKWADDFTKEKPSPSVSAKIDSHKVASVVDDELTNLGYPSHSRLALLGNVGRENNWNPNIIFGGHSDPKNQAKNRGLMSWQGTRRQGLENFIKKNGGDWTPSENNLRLQARYLDNELQSKYPQIHSTLTNPDADLPTISRQLRNYINYVPSAPYNTPDKEYDTKNNRIWAEKAKGLGLGQDVNGNDPDFWGSVDTVLQPVPQDDIWDKVNEVVQPELVASNGKLSPTDVSQPQLFATPDERMPPDTSTMNNGVIAMGAGQGYEPPPNVLQKFGEPSELALSGQGRQVPSGVGQRREVRPKAQTIPAPAALDKQGHSTVAVSPEEYDPVTGEAIPPETLQPSVQTAHQESDNPTLGTVTVDPKWSDEQKVRFAANKILGQYDVTPQGIEKWISQAKARLKDEPNALVQGDRSESEFQVKKQMLDQIRGDFFTPSTPEEIKAREKKELLAAPTDEQYRQQAIDDLTNRKHLAAWGTNEPYAEPTDEEIQAKVDELKSQELSPQDKEYAYNSAQYMNDSIAGGGLAGWVGSSGSALHTIAGSVLRPLAALGIPSGYETLRDLGKQMQLAESLEKDSSIGKFVGSLPINLGEMVLGGNVIKAAQLPGGAIGLFAFLGGAKSAGAGEPLTKVAQKTIQGGGTGAGFEFAPLVGKAVAAKAPELENAAQLGTVFGTSVAANAAAGMPISENLQSAITNTLWKGHELYGSKILDNTYRFWKGGQPFDVSVTPKGKIELQKNTGVPITGGEIVLDPTNPVYKQPEPEFRTTEGKSVGTPKQAPVEAANVSPKPESETQKDLSLTSETQSAEAVPAAAPAQEKGVEAKETATKGNRDVIVDGEPVKNGDWLLFKKTNTPFQVANAFYDHWQDVDLINPSYDTFKTHGRVPNEIAAGEVERLTQPPEQAPPQGADEPATAKPKTVAEAKATKLAKAKPLSVSEQNRADWQNKVEAKLANLEPEHRAKITEGYDLDKITTGQLKDLYNAIEQPRQQKASPLVEAVNKPIPRKTKTTPDSLSQMVRRMGGLDANDKWDSGEINRVSNKQTGTTGLVKKGGRSIHDLSEAAHEAGYFQEMPSQSEFMEALENDATGHTKHYALYGDTTPEEVAGRSIEDQDILRHAERTRQEDTERRLNSLSPFADKHRDATSAFLGDPDVMIVLGKAENYSELSKEDAIILRRKARSYGLEKDIGRQIVDELATHAETRRLAQETSAFVNERDRGTSEPSREEVSQPKEKVKPATAFDQVDLFGRKLTPQTEQKAMFDKGENTSSDIEQLIEKVPDSQLKKDAQDALYIYNRAQQAKTDVGSMLKQQDLEGKTVAEHTTPEAVAFAKALENGTFEKAFGEARIAETKGKPETAQPQPRGEPTKGESGGEHLSGEMKALGELHRDITGKKSESWNEFATKAIKTNREHEAQQAAKPAAEPVESKGEPVAVLPPEPKIETVKPATSASLKSGDQVQMRNKYSIKKVGKVFADKEGNLHVEELGTKARLPIDLPWEKTSKQVVLDKAQAKQAKKSFTNPDNLKAGEYASNEGRVGRVYERGGQLRVKYELDGKPKSEPLSDAWKKSANPQAGSVDPTLLTFGLNKTISEDVAPGIRRAGRGLKDAAEDIKKLVFAGGRGEASTIAGGSLRAELGKMARSALVAERALKDARKYFSKNPVEDNYDFISQVEGGDISSLPPSEQSAATELRRLLDESRTRVQNLGTGKLEQYIENYFPHIWKDPKEATSVFGKMLSKRPFEGSKAFLKQRTYNTFQEGLDAGLIPVSDNPIDLTLLKIRDMDKYVAAHRTMNYLKAKGLAQYVPIGGEVPDGFAKIDDKISTVFGNPNVSFKEGFDKGLMDSLTKFAADMNIPHERLINIGGKRWGYAVGGSHIVSKFAGPESVLAHEIGHILDARYHLADKFVNDPLFKKELRTLADQRYAGQEAPDAYKRYVRKGTEKMAVMFESLIHAPEIFREVAPNTYKELLKFINSHEELKPLLKIKPSLVLSGDVAEKRVAGMVISGNIYAVEPAANILNNYLSPGLSDSKVGAVRDGYKAWRYMGNLMNQAQLGLSAFHAAFTTIDVAISKTALGLDKMFSGRPVQGMKELAGVPISPLTNLLEGHRIMKEGLTPGSTDDATRVIADLVAESGGRFKMDDFYHTKVSQNMMDAFRRGNILGGVIRIPASIFETASKPLMEGLVPRQKLGVFAGMAKHTLERLGADATPEQIREALGKDWDSVDNRMGQLVYDNLFWNKTIKDLAMASVRSVGWNLGSIREIPGGVKDTLTLPLRVSKALKGEKMVEPVITRRMTYSASLPVITGIIGATTMYLMTGKGPQELKDYFFPKTGNTDENGNDERLNLPTYMKDVYAYGKHPLKTLGHKAHPLIGMVAEMLSNKDYFGTEIRNADDPFIQQLTDEAVHLGKGFVPFSVQGMLKEKERQGSTTTKALSFFGFNPAPKDIDNTAAQDLAFEIYAANKGDAPKTKASVARNREISDLVRLKKRGQKEAYQQEFNKAVKAGVISPQDAKQVTQRMKKDFFQYAVTTMQLPDALDVYEAATPDERTKLQRIMHTKIHNAGQKGHLTTQDKERIKKLGFGQAPKESDDEE